ncbi:hypothetical protein [Limnospira fusiformis]|uniref:hypothetical protein n=1 Tax=Limnospira fusiformis TaxID=54297 RepID=UPI001448FBDB|nr:hypothetical protein HFV01_11755 [Limnospira fusiformis SAG 85.79]
MSVTNLYCEGGPKSIDIRVIRQLLPKCEIHPLGGKTSSFLSSIIADRDRQPNLACLVDHDFDCQDWPITNEPIRCVYDQIWVGWAWERKEIENYLIDPVVVREALGKKAPSDSEYQNALDQAAQKIAAYSAARTALACEKFKNLWGDKVRQGHSFPPKLGEDYCEVRIAEIVRKYKGERIVSEKDVQGKFRDLLPKFKSAGSRFQNYLHYFAGKDLLYAMRDKLGDWGFEDSSNKKHPEEVFIERVVTRIERTDGVWEWLPEWKKLRQLIEETDFSES